jgi:hypothetical protein
MTRIPLSAPKSSATDRRPASESSTRELGKPLGIRETAELIGCSPWTVRQRHIPQGLPHFRSGPSGKLIFYRDQVIRWILEQQQEGGTRP